MDRGLGSRFGYSIGSSNPFNKSGIVTDRTTPRSHMAKRSIGYRSSAKKRGTTRVVSKKRVAATRKKSTKKTSKRKRVAKGTFRKPKRVKRVSVKYHKHRYEEEGKIDKSQGYCYVKTNDQYNRGAIFMAMSDALLRPILRKYCRFIPLQDSDVFPTHPDFKRLAFDFKRVRVSGTESFIDSMADAQNILNYTVLLDGQTYDQMREKLAEMIRLAGDASSGSNIPDDDTVAYFPYKLRIVDTNDVVRTTFDHLGETMIDLKFSQKVSFLNKTKNDSNNNNTDTTGQNPLKGKLYQFSHMEPRLKDHFTTSYRQIIQDNETLGVYAFPIDGDVEPELQHPLDSKYWLKNCTKESSIYLAPGGYKTHSTSKIIKGKLSTLIERLYYSGFDKGSFGCSSMFMFDMVHHSKNDAHALINLELEYKRTCFAFSYGRLFQPKLYIPDFDVVPLVNTAGFAAEQGVVGAETPPADPDSDPDPDPDPDPDSDIDPDPDPESEPEPPASSHTATGVSVNGSYYWRIEDPSGVLVGNVFSIDYNPALNANSNTVGTVYNVVYGNGVWVII